MAMRLVSNVMATSSMSSEEHGAKAGGKRNKVVPVDAGGVPTSLPKENDSVRRLKDPEQWTGLAKKYLLFAREIEKITLSDWFSMFIIGVILLAGGLVGLQTYAWAQDKDAEAILSSIDQVILIIFIIECVLKILAEGLEPWRYFTGPEWAWNNFDFLIVFFCLDLGILSSEDSGSVALLRLFRLARIAKLVRKIPQLQMIIMGLFGGLKSIGYILLLMFLVFYLYAIVGVFSFKENDPYHFGSVRTALLTMFRMATLEDWTDVMYINYLGCHEKTNYSQDQDLIFHSGFYTDEDILFRNSETLFHCNSTTADTRIPSGFALFYFVTFILISALVILSLFIGAVTMSMSESMESMKALKDRDTRKRTLSTDDDEVTVIAKHKHTFSAAEKRKQKQMKEILRSAFKDDGVAETPKMRMRSPSSFHLNKNFYDRLATKAYNVSRSKTFDKIIMCVIIWAGVMVGISTEKEFSETHEDTLSVIENVILWIFILEAVIKIVGEGREPWKYIYDTDAHKFNGWNIFDAAVILGSVIPIGNGQDIVVVLRLLRLLRVLKLVKSVPKLQIIVVALINGLGSIGYIALILLMVFYMFGILGMILFSDNDPIHFGTLDITIVTLFRCSTLEDWTDVMYINAFGCRYYGYAGLEDLCFEPDGGTGLSWIYFLIFTVIGAFILMTLFIGVVTTSMDEAREGQARDMEARSAMNVMKNELKISDNVMSAYEQCFDMLDADDSGLIEIHEILLGLRVIGEKMSEEKMLRLIERLTGNTTGEMNLCDFCVFMHKVRSRDIAVKENETMSTASVPSIAAGSTKENERPETKT